MSATAMSLIQSLLSLLKASSLEGIAEVCGVGLTTEKRVVNSVKE